MAIINLDNKPKNLDPDHAYFGTRTFWVYNNPPQGKLTLDINQLVLHTYTENGRNCDCSEGVFCGRDDDYRENRLYKEMTAKSGYNANLLDYFIDNQEEIPITWRKDAEERKRYIYFQTIYKRHDDSFLFFPFMYFVDEVINGDGQKKKGTGIWRRSSHWINQISGCPFVVGCFIGQKL